MAKHKKPHKQYHRKHHQQHHKQHRHRKTHGFPALISFFIPGLGQLIKGNILKGIFIFIAMIISSLSSIILIGFITTPIIWIWNVYDAYNN